MQVVALNILPYFYNLRFESSVISYGSKTSSLTEIDNPLFESSVISYGSKTKCLPTMDTM